MQVKPFFKYWPQQVLSPGTAAKTKYKAFKSLQEHDKRAHELMAELEEIFYHQRVVDFALVEEKYNALTDHVSQMIEALGAIHPTRYRELGTFFRKMDQYVRHMLNPGEMQTAPPYAVPLAEVTSENFALVGSKAFNLGTVSDALRFPVPDGFVITTHAFYRFIEANRLQHQIQSRLKPVDIYSTDSLHAVSGDLTAMIMNAEIPPEIADAMDASVRALRASQGDGDLRLAMRSSAAGEDTRTSFAGQYQTLLNVSPDQVHASYKRVLASKYSPGAIYYRTSCGLTDMETPMAVLGLVMIDALASGVMYTRGPEPTVSDALTIHAVKGLGEPLVSGQATPEVFDVSRNDPLSVAGRSSPLKSSKVADSGAQEVEGDEGSSALQDADVLKLAEWGMALETYFGEAQDIEWCKDQAGRLLVLQTRPLQTRRIDPLTEPVCEWPDMEDKLLFSGGETASGGIGGGKIFRVDPGIDPSTVPNGAVLAARHAPPDYVKIIDRLNAVITETGSVAGHFSSVAREFNVPTLVNVGRRWDALTHGTAVTVDANRKTVYHGTLDELLESPCAKRNRLTDSPFMRRMEYVIDFVSPLRLTDPQAADFKPEGVRSLHDIIRFCHEKAVQEMFHISNRRLVKPRGARKLRSEIPMGVYVLDVGGGVVEDVPAGKTVDIEAIRSNPMRSLLRGMLHPDIRWEAFRHFDWAEHDKIVMSGGIISPDAAMFASHAVIASDYANLNLKFGYHFVILDAVCGDSVEDNYILFRFSGGGADYDQRTLRAEFLTRVLQRLEFEVNRKGDLVNARIEAVDSTIVSEKLDWLGRLLGASRLLDMYLKDESMVSEFVEGFMKGRYHFATVDTQT